MNTIYIILAFLFIATLVYYFVFYRRGKIKDKDGDFIPDEVENTVEEIRQRAKDVKEEMEDVIEATKEVVKQAGDRS